MRQFDVPVAIAIHIARRIDRDARVPIVDRRVANAIALPTQRRVEIIGRIVFPRLPLEFHLQVVCMLWLQGSISFHDVQRVERIVLLDQVGGRGLLGTVTILEIYITISLVPTATEVDFRDEEKVILSNLSIECSPRVFEVNMLVREWELQQYIPFGGLVLQIQCKIVPHGVRTQLKRILSVKMLQILYFGG